MRATKRMKKAVSSLLALSLVLSYVPLPTLAEEGCTHHVHDESCGYVEGAACTFDPAACEQCNVLGNQSADWCGNPLCSQEDNAHAPACEQYVRTYELCTCVLSCAEEGLNDWCEACHFGGVEACTGGEEEQIAYATSGTTGECTWTLDDDGVLTISGKGSMSSSEFESNENIFQVIIDQGVKNIGNSAFRNCTRLKSVTIPASVTTIGNNAFNGCDSLTTVKYLGKSEPDVRAYAFRKCDLKEVNVPAGYNSDTFGDLPVKFDTEATTYTVTFHLNGYGTAIPQQSVTENGKVEKPEDPTAEGQIFAGWYADEELTTEWNFETNTVTDDTDLYAKWTVTCEHDWDTYTGICGYCSENHGDHDYTWTDGACSVCGVVGGYCGYTGDETLVEYVLTSENEGSTYTITISGTGKMGEYNTGSYDTTKQPWKDYCNKITTAVVNSGVQDVGWGAFQNHTKLTSVSIPASITTIGSMAFSGTTSLRSVTLPSALTSLGSNAFYNSGIESITIPAGVTQIQYKTFLKSKLSSITFLGNVTIIDTSAFQDCKKLTSITLPNTLTTIGTEAFSGSNLTSVTIPSSVTKIGASAFQGCKALETVSISGDDLEVMKQAFCYNNALETLTITNAGAVSLGQRAFGIQQNTTDKLDSINLSDTVTLYNNSYADVFEYRRTPVTGVSLDKTEMTVYIGNSEKLTATVEPGTATNKKVTWSSSDNNIATVDTEGNVTGVAGGTAIITVTTADGSKTATCTVTVPAHTHNWTYTAKGATITATCGEANCPVSEGKVTITLNTPEDLTYNSTAKSVTVTQNPAGVFTDIPAVTYEGNRIDAGRHTASLTYGEETATLTFTIEKATISSVAVDVTAPVAGAAPQSTVTCGTGYSAAIAWTPGAEKFGFNTVYTATVTLTPDGNHQFDNGINVEDWDLSNSEGILTLTRTFNATRMEKLKGVTVPEDQTLTVYCANADAVIEKLPASVTYTTETGTKTAEIQWTCTDYNPAPNAENTFNWAANSGELTGYDVNGQVTSGSVKVTNVDATPVTINANDLEIVYSGETYDVAKLFTIDENAGAASYTITEKTGEGSLAGSVLTVTKAGTFTIELNTAANDPYASGKAIAVLTVTKGSGSGSVTAEGWTYGETAKTPVPASETNGTDNVTYQYKVKDANDAAYGNEKPTNAGTYTVKATFAANDLYAETTATANFTIAKATYDMSGAKWDYTEAFAYDGMEHTVAVSGLPTGVTVGGYTGNTATTVGEYTAAVILSYDEENYNEPTIADLNWAIVNDWEPTEFTFTALNGNGYSNTDFVVTAAEGYSISTTNTADGTWAASLTKSEETAEGEVTFYLKNNATGAISLAKTLSYKLDKNNPTGKVEFVERTSWQEFVNGITFGLFYKTEVTVKAEAADTLSGVETIEYAASNKSMTLDEVEAITSWQAMSENGVSVALEDTKKFVYFVKITDKAGNVIYLSTNGAEYDTTAPVIGGIENGAVYYTTQTATVTEKNLDVVTLNGEVAGTTITLEGNKEATHTIVVKDKAGNEATVTVTMKPIAFLGETIKNLTVNNATSADQAKIQTVLDAVEEVLEAENIPEDEKAALIDLQNRAKALLKVIADAVAAINTEDIRNVADKNETNIKLDDKADLKKARTALEEALEEYQGNYTDQEQTVIRKEIERLTKAIETIEQTEAVITAIQVLPKSVEPDLDEKMEKAIREAKAAYDKLTDYQKSLMDKDDKVKLEKLIDSLDDYEIIKGSGKKWEKGSGQSLQFTANGPVRKFKELRIDGDVVGTSNYTIKEGSTIITLKASYLQTLSTGKHTIQFRYTDGMTDGEDTFQICQSAGNPGTGDNNHMMMLTGIMMTSLLCMAAMVMLAPRRKGKYEK